MAFLVVAARGRRLRMMAEDGAKQQQVNAYVAARNMIADYGSLMEKHPLGPAGIADISHLPHPKDDLIAAFRVVLLVTKERPLRGQLQAAALMLAQYQPNVGPEVIVPLRLASPAALQRMTGEEMAAAVLAGSSDADRWEKLNVNVDRDLKRIAAAIGSSVLPMPT